MGYLMKKILVAALTAILFFSIPFVASTQAATLVSLSAKKSDNAAKEIEFTGNGKYMKFTCTYSGSTSKDNIDALCEVRKNASPSNSVQRFYVGGSKGNKSESTDVWLDKGVKYSIYVNVETHAPSNASVTGVIKDR